MKKFLKEAKGHLMTGIGYMLPMIIGASLIVAIPQLIALAMGITSLTEDLTGFAGFLYDFQQAGWTGIGLVNTVLGGFVAYSIANKPGLAAGLIGGAVATSTQAGFIGAVVYAFIGGYLVRWAMKTIKVPESAQAIMPNVVLPLIASVGVALVAVLLAGPLSAINLAIIDWLTVMCQEDSNRIIMAVILGAMIGFDMGGPVNKAAWTATNALMLAGIYTPCVYTNLAITIPPLGYAIAALIRKDRFSADLRNSAAGNWVMSFIGITEGAIPFTLVKPTRLIPINVIGSALGAGIGAALGTIAEIPPLGGWYGFITMVNPWGYLIGIAVGGLFIAITSTALVDFRDDSAEEVSEDDIEISFE